MKRRGITFFRRKNLVSQCRKSSWASLQCFRNFSVSKTFMHNRGITFFRRKFLVSQYRKISWTSLQCFRKIGLPKNFLHNRGYHNFPSNVFCLTVPKKFVKEPVCVSEIFGYRKTLCLRGEYYDFLEKICCLTVPKNFIGEPFCAVFQKMSGSEKFYG